MNKIYTTILFVAAILCMTACNNKKAPKLETAEDTLSWALGESFAMSVMQNNLSVDKDLVIEAFRHTVEGWEQPFDESVCEEAYKRLTMQAMQQQQQRVQSQNKDVAAKEEAYFQKLVAENPNVKKSDKGFYYEVLKSGKGKNAKFGERVSFDYKGYYMLTGEQFDQSNGYSGGEPIIHVVGNPMFPGLLEGMQLMNAGSLYRFYFPNQLAFGANGSEDIPPYTAVIYEVELHEIMND